MQCTLGKIVSYKRICTFRYLATFSFRGLVYCILIFTNLSARDEYDTRSIFKRSLTGLNSECSFS